MANRNNRNQNQNAQKIQDAAAAENAKNNTAGANPAETQTAELQQGEANQANAGEGAENQNPDAATQAVLAAGETPSGAPVAGEVDGKIYTNEDNLQAAQDAKAAAGGAEQGQVNTVQPAPADNVVADKPKNKKDKDEKDEPAPESVREVQMVKHNNGSEQIVDVKTRPIATN